MKAYTENLHKELLSKLGELDKQYDPQIPSDPRLSLISATIDQIKEKLKPHVFSSQEDEVYYFKCVLPPTLALYIYYTDKIEWDRICRQGSPDCRYKFIDRVYAQAEKFRKENHSFYTYLRDGIREMDRFFFLRISPFNREINYPLRHIADRSSPPLHCEMYATWIAYTRMEHEVKMRLAENMEKPSPIKSGKLKLRWTGKQIDLIELGYGLREMGSFNEGKASLNEIFDLFAESFDIDTGNTSRLFQDIMGRKAGYTLFLDLMKQKLHKRIDDIENEHLN